MTSNDVACAGVSIFVTSILEMPLVEADELAAYMLCTGFTASLWHNYGFLSCVSVTVADMFVTLDGKSCHRSLNMMIV